MRLSATLLAIVVACGGGQAAEPEPIGTPGTGPAYSSVEPSTEVAELAADFRGSCSFARPPGEAAQYTVRLQAKSTSLGTIRVRGSASFDVRIRENLIGEIPSGSELAAAGPLAGGSEAGGTGYAVLVRDGHGRVCRGYVSSRSVEPPN